MAKMRDNLPAILLSLVILFLLTIVLDWGMDITGRHRSNGFAREPIGIVNGEEITYQEFNQALEFEIENFKQRTGNDPDDFMLEQLRNQVWEQLVTRKLIEQEIKKLNLTVTDEEITDWVLNSPETLPEPVKRNFVDSTGKIDRVLLERALKSTTPQARQFWIEVEKFLKAQKLTEKLQSRLLASVLVSEGEIRERFEKQNTRYEIKYVSLDPNRFSKEISEPTDDEIKEYYRNHQDEFRIQETRRLKYVLFSDMPSAEDTASVLRELENFKQQAMQGADFVELVKNYSEAPFSDVFFKHGELLPEIENEIWDKKVGEIVGPLKASDGIHLIKILDERKGSDTFVRASHILVPIGRDTAESYNLAKDILNLAKKGEDFAKLAATFSVDQVTASKGGDLGWFGKGRMVKEFEEACFKAKPGEIVGPVRTQYGLHIIKVIAKDNRELKIADIKLGVRASSETIESQRKRAEDFSHTVSGKKFVQEASALGLDIKTTPPFTKDSPIPGIGFNKTISDWAFSNKLGSVSPVFKIRGGFAVFTISEIKEAGIRPLEEVREAIKVRVRREKLKDKAYNYLESLRTKLNKNEGLESITKLDSTLEVKTASGFTLSGGIPGIGTDENVLGKLIDMKPNEISQTIKGNSFVYLIQLVNKTPFDSSAYKSQHETLKQQIYNEKKNTLFFSWIDNLKKNAKIVDNRSLYFEQ
ncbi:peptidyl-prolyl cis-trans isomerase D [Candidatus Kryptonium thompsonii]|uniref:Periplasmic chaperone PpiD n=4 Tax=Candidatus Kryptonium thompsonii TaxID=1633631 RepID=A0A0P1LLQ7_9BACT|nr:peptidylprolyl isomerase [Candidatus Kryptonium thompsoni]CUS79600.1 peptidyl-prolyl cis-trans isomerase D [Candidatus Kryptonium thompsoni]CUS82794.1 peptidyl-prolyl cis-trans isomerase D [Candidatus Kryptonium thompsoni]CUS84440.1 peptidyl-prolyl cis-trans isomerase D [Candidatus Kryptonium thompsoni]CUS85666.1 peptidyl-prolyl cis-trans isomerase D [Candidatus Kryptonium thompsoni]CUS85700.1 peptidyl-prolyl cis-trans isomerase D [Candidatus Kryptonium thompsoni]